MRARATKLSAIGFNKSRDVLPSLDLAFAADKTLTARKGPTPTFTRGSGNNGSVTYVGPNKIIVNGNLSNLLSQNPSIINQRFFWQSALVGDVEYTAQYMGDRWRLRIRVVGDEAQEIDYFAAIGSEWLPYLADWSESGITVVAGNTIGIVKAVNDEPRFDHDPVTGICRGLLIEEQRTNIIPRSSNFPAGNWTINAGRLTWALDAIGPDGALSATTLTATGLSGAAFINSAGQMLAGVTYTHSAIVKAGNTNFVGISSFDGTNDIGAMFNLSTGTFVGYRTPGATPISNSITPLGGGWYRVSFTYTSANTYSGFSAQILISQAGNLNFGTPCTAGTSIIAFAYQMEAGSFPTSYIPTTGAALTRSADVCSITGADFTSFYNQSEGTVVANVVMASGTGASNQAPFSFSANNTQNIIISFRGIGAFLNTARLAVLVANVDQTSDIASYGALNNNVSGKIGNAYGVNNFAASVNGGLVTDSTGTMPTVDRMFIGDRIDGLRPWGGHIARIQYFRKRLPNAKLQSLTT